MHWFLKTFVLPLLEALQPRVIVEVGVEVGAVTRPLLEWARDAEAILHAIDPDPNLDVEQIASEYGEQLRFHRVKSLPLLGELEAVELALIDGDHNWYTVINELRALQARALTDQRQPPAILLHDVGWPYGRRDLYYDPDSIPEPYRHNHARRGIVPGQVELGNGINEHLENATLEGTPANGVLTAVEDFVAEAETDWFMHTIPGLSGLTVLVPEALRRENAAVAELLQSLQSPEFLRRQCEVIEAARIQGEAKRAGLARRLAQTQLKQVLKSADPEQLLELRRQVRELQEQVREQRDQLDTVDDLREQLALTTGWEQQATGSERRLRFEPLAGADGQDRPRLRFSPVVNGAGERELRAANAQRLLLQSALGRARADVELADAGRRQLELRVAELADQLQRSTEARASDPLPAAPADAAATVTLDDCEPERLARQTFLEAYLGLVEDAISIDERRDPMALALPRDSRGLLAAAGAEQEPGQPSVDVIVCVHDALEDVLRCLWSLLAKTDRRLRLILVDDGSDERTARVLDQLADRHPAITLIRRAAPHGYTLAANAGLRASTAEYVVLLNSDTIVTGDWLSRIIAHGERHPEVGILGPLSNAASHQSVPRLRDDAGGWATNPLPDWLTVEALALVLERAAPRVDARPPFLNGFCYVVKRVVIEAIGELDELRFAAGYCEENDYSQRAREAGFELAVVDDAYVYHAKSRSYGSDGRAPLAREHYELFRAKHGAQQIDALVSAQEADTTLAPVRAAVSAALAGPTALAPLLSGGGRRPLSIVFVLPGLPYGGSGGSHSIYQEVRGLRALGVPARIALAHWDWERARSVYADAEEIFQVFSDDEDLAAKTADADVISATHYKSVAMLHALAERRQDFLPAYYVQDYEPLFTAGYTAATATESYASVPGMLLFAKSHWLCNVVAERHGIAVAKVEPSIDEQLFTAPPTPPATDGPVRITAMVRPRTLRRQPFSTVSVFERLAARLPGQVELTTFGCYADELKEITANPEIFDNHRGMLSRGEVAELLRGSHVFLDMSLYQAFGRTALEAMACGATAVVPGIGGVWEFIRDGENALALDTLDRELVVDALANLVEDRDRLERMRTAAQATGARYSIAAASLSEYLLFERAHRARFGER